MFFTPVTFFTSTQGNAAFVVTTQPGLSATLTTSSPNQKTFSISLWAKPTATGSTNEALAFSGSGWTSYSLAFIDPTTSTKRVRFQSVEASATLASPMSGNTVYTSASWTHYLYAVDTTQATAADRIKFYVNGSLVAHVSGTEPTQNANMHWLVNGETFYIAASPSSADLFTGRIAYVDIVDGIQLAPGDVTVDISGTLHAKDCTRDHGTNGLQLWGGTKLIDAWRGVTFSGTGLSYDYIDKPQYKKQPISLGSSMTSSVGSTVYTTLRNITQTFYSTQSWAIPIGVSTLSPVDVYGNGAKGEAASYGNTNPNGGGSGGYARTNTVSVSYGSTAYIDLSGGSSFNINWFNRSSNARPTSTTDGAAASSRQIGTYYQAGASSGYAVGDTLINGNNGDGYNGTGGSAPGPLGGAGGPKGSGIAHINGYDGTVPGGGGGAGTEVTLGENTSYGLGGNGALGMVVVQYSQRL